MRISSQKRKDHATAAFPFLLCSEFLMPISVNKLWIEAFFPGKSPLTQSLHERIGIEFLNVPYARFFPFAGKSPPRAYHSGSARGVGYRLRAYLAVAFLMIADVVNILLYRLSVLEALHYAADVGLALCAGTKRRGVGQDSFKELERNYFLTLEVDRLD